MSNEKKEYVITHGSVYQGGEQKKVGDVVLLTQADAKAMGHNGHNLKLKTVFDIEAKGEKAKQAALERAAKEEAELLAELEREEKAKQAKGEKAKGGGEK